MIAEIATEAFGWFMILFVIFVAFWVYIWPGLKRTFFTFAYWVWMKNEQNITRMRHQKR